MSRCVLIGQFPVAMVTAKRNIIRTQYQSNRKYSCLVLVVQNFSQSGVLLGYHSNHDDKNVIFEILVQWALQWYMVIMGFNEWMTQKNELQNMPNPRLSPQTKRAQCRSLTSTNHRRGSQVIITLFQTWMAPN